jgi:hypothetical protein
LISQHKAHRESTLRKDIQLSTDTEPIKDVPPVEGGDEAERRGVSDDLIYITDEVVVDLRVDE